MKIQPRMNNAITALSFAVYPEKMIALNAIPFAVGQLKAVMALFILGWIFTVLGLRRAAQVVC